MRLTARFFPVQVSVHGLANVRQKEAMSMPWKAAQEGNWGGVRKLNKFDSTRFPTSCDVASGVQGYVVLALAHSRSARNLYGHFDSDDASSC